MTARGFDVHQHLWPEAFVEALRSRSRSPRMDGWTLYLDGEPPYEVNPRDHNESARAALDASVALVALSLSCPLGVEYLPIDEAVPLLDAWHTGVAAFGTPFVGWASVSHVEPDLVGLRSLLAADFVGAQVSATELADPHALERLAPVLEVAQSAGRAVLVHPGPVAPRASAWSGEPGWWPAVVDYAAQMQAAWWTWSLVGRSLLPTVRICFAAGAGLAPLHHERFTARGGGPLVVDRDAFVDTSSYARTGLRGLISVLGDDVVVMGSDRPYAPPTDPDLGPEATEAIRVTNPARLLGR
jgi:hypothetical protein